MKANMWSKTCEKLTCGFLETKNTETPMDSKSNRSLLVSINSHIHRVHFYSTELIMIVSKF